MKRVFEVLSIAVVLSSCVTSGGGPSFTNPLVGDPDMAKLTNNGKTFPSSGDVTNLLDDKLSGPKSKCSKIEDEAPKASLPTNGTGVCKHFKNFTDQGVPEDALKQALLFYKNNPRKFKNKRYVSIADYSKNSTQKRFYQLDMETGRVKKYKVSHGSGNKRGIKYGDMDHDGMIDRCMKNGSRTNMTRPGFFATGEQYMSTGKHNSHIERRNRSGHVYKGWPYIDSNNRKNALRLDGLTPSVNGQARNNGVVMHGAWYNDSAVTGQERMGRSYGCPAFDPKYTPKILNTINGGSLYYSYVPKCASDMRKAIAQVPGWKSMCD